MNLLKRLPKRKFLIGLVFTCLFVFTSSVPVFAQDPPPYHPAADMTADGEVDILDLAYVGSRFGSDDPLADINNDGLVDILDLIALVLAWGPC